MFTEKEKMLANEAALTSSLLGNGLNSLRKASIYNKGLYYQAFFSLSIGIERLLKIIIIAQYRVENKGEFPTSINLKKIGHDLVKLCEYIGVKFEQGSIQEKIVIFLNDFAKKSRYYNIDSMIDANIQYYDPLCEWATLSEIIFQTSKKRKIVSNKKELAQLIDCFSLFDFYDLEGKEVNDALSVLDIYEKQEIIQGYSVQYTFEIITKIVGELRKLQEREYLMPVLTEFFPLYYKYWKPYQIRKKKNWLREY